MRRIALVAFVLVLPAGCAAVIDWNALSDDGGADASVDSSSRRDATADADGGIDVGSSDTGKQSDAGGSDPCAQVLCGYFCDGYYCGGSAQNGFSGGSPGTLYLCVDGSTAGQQVCSRDCVIAPAKHPDSCDHCVGYADGTYCGYSLGYDDGGYNGAFAYLLNVVFTCEGGITSAPEQPCTAPTSTCVQSGNAARCSDGG